MLENGTMLNDRYEIVSVVGSGGMSDVYKAKCHKLNRYVAIKVLKKEFNTDKSFIAKFRAEAQSAAGLSHPNIVSIYDVGEDNGLYYIVMELVEGITLKAYIEKKGRLEVKEAVSVAIQVAQGIRAAHAHHIIHRDIKPQNIIISKDGKVKVTDFGIARVSSADTIKSNAMGSVHYISPEQARGGYVDERSDIYSLGISLYEMITGRVPFESDTAVSVALMHLQNELPSPRAIVPNLPVSVEKIIYKCTQKKPDRRYADADSLIEDLKMVLANPNYSAAAGRQQAASDINTEIAAEDEGTVKVWSKPENSKENTRKKDFLEKMYSDEKKKNPVVERILTGVTVAAALLVVIALVYGIIWIKNTLTPPDLFETEPNQSSTNNLPPGVSDVTMPYLIGYTSGDAIIELNKKNLKNRLSYDYSDVYEKGLVISQQYSEGTALERNTEVELVISLGINEFEILDYKSYAAADVEDMLTKSRLVFLPVFMWDSEVAMGHVIKTEPAAGEKVHSGAVVTVYISRGTEFRNVTVPSIVGSTPEEAAAVLEALGLFIGNISEAESSTVAKGRIITQSILANSVLEQGTAIDITVSSGTPFPTASLILQRSQFSKYISEEKNAFHKPYGPGVASDVMYSYAVLTVELKQTNEWGVESTKTVKTLTVTAADFPLQVDSIEGIMNINDGTVVVYLTIGETRYNTGSYYIEFH